MHLDNSANFDAFGGQRPPQPGPLTIPQSGYGDDRMDQQSTSTDYDMFGQPTHQSSPYQRMRSNTSPAAPTWNGNHDSLYSQHSNYGSDSVPSFNSASSAGSYDMMSSISSNYSSGKQTPLTPNDPMHHPFGGILKQEPQSAYPDLTPDRRLSYGQPDVHDDYSQLGAQGFGNTSLPPFNRFQQSDPLYPPTTIPSHGSHFGRPDQAGYDDVQTYLPNPGADHLSLRIPGIDDNMMRRIQPHGGLHSAGDLSSFIRSVSASSRDIIVTFASKPADTPLQALPRAVCARTQSPCIRRALRYCHVVQGRTKVVRTRKAVRSIVYIL